MVDICRGDAGVSQQTVGTLADVRQFLIDPLLKACPGQWSLNLHNRIVELKEAFVF